MREGSSYILLILGYLLVKVQATQWLGRLALVNNRRSLTEILRLFEVLQWHPLSLIHIQTLLYEHFHLLRYLNCKGNWNSHHFLHQLLLGFALPGSLPMEQLIHNDSYWPYIVLNTIDVLLQGLGWHIEGTSHIILFPLTWVPTLLYSILVLFSKSEVCQLGSTILEKDIG